MKIAYIAPIPELEYTTRSDLHLVLPHVFKEPFGHRYKEHYRLCRSQGDYLILDNGADEFGKATVRLPAILGHARQMRAQEVVLPDVQQDGEATAAAVETACEWLVTDAGKSAYQAAERPRFMLVPQGRSYDEWFDCFTRIYIATSGALSAIGVEPDRQLLVVGVAKNHDNKVLGGVTRLVYTLQHLNVDIHLLGWPKNSASMRSVVDLDCVRSVDTARPFVYAMHGSTCANINGHPNPYPGRGENYFRRAITPALRSLVLKNMEYYEGQLTND